MNFEIDVKNDDLLRHSRTMKKKSHYAEKIMKTELQNSSVSLKRVSK